MQDFVRMMYPSANESNVRQLMSMGRDHKTTYVVKMTPERIREMKATFKECDIDNSGDVSRSEFVDGIQNAGKPSCLGLCNYAHYSFLVNSAILLSNYPNFRYTARVLQHFKQ